MNHAFPLDELRPLDCSGRTKDNDPDNWLVIFAEFKGLMAQSPMIGA